MAEWHLPPDYILGNWTDEMLKLMIDKLIERKERINEALAGDRDNPKQQSTISDKQFFDLVGAKVVRN